MEKIGEDSLRKLVNKLLEDKTLGPAMISVNPVVDPSAALTDPANPNYKPDSKKELSVALTSMVNNLPDEKVGDAYETIKTSLSSHDVEKENEMKKDTKTEQLVRLAVRNILSEISKKKEEEAKKKWASGLSGEEARAEFLSRGGAVTKLPPSARGIPKGPDTPAVKKLRSDLESLSMDSDQAAGGVNLMVQDVGGKGLKELAEEFGFKNPNGVLQWINKVLDKVRTRTENFEALQLLALEAINDYIEELTIAAEPDLTQDDVQLMKDNPQIVASLESFKIYLSKRLRKAGM